MSLGDVLEGHQAVVGIPSKVEGKVDSIGGRCGHCREQGKERGGDVCYDKSLEPSVLMLCSECI